MNDSDNVLRIGLFTDYQIRFLIPNPRNRRVKVVDRSCLPLSILKNITQEHTGDKYMRGVISSLVNVDVHVVPLYRCLQGIYGSLHGIYCLSPLWHIWYEPINPLIEEFLTLLLGRILRQYMPR